MNRSFALLRIIVIGIYITIVLPMRSQAQLFKSGMHLSMMPVVVIPNGEFQANRPNGKHVTTDVTAGLVIGLFLSTSVSDRIDTSMGYVGLSNHKVKLSQYFPDNSTFLSSDQYTFHSYQLRADYLIAQTNQLKITLGAIVSYAIYNDIYLMSAGPPYDRFAPLDISVNDNLRVGLSVGLERQVSKRLAAILDLALVLHRFKGEFETEDDLDPVSDIDLPLNPLNLGLGIKWAITEADEFYN